MEIRAEEPGDIEQVREVLRAAFRTEAESKLVDALRENGQAVISLVAVRDGEVLGHILFSPVTSAPPGEAKGLGLAPLAVRPAAQSQGIGSRLVQEGLRLCKERGYDFCVVLGDPRYYQRFGFEQASPFGIRNEYGVDEEFMIHYFSSCRAQGLVRYGSEFARFSV